MTEEALLGRLDGSLEVECCLLCDDLGREERCVRLDVFVSVVWHDEDFVEQRLDVCQVPHGAGGSESESDGECVVVVVELQQVEEDDLK